MFKEVSLVYFSSTKTTQRTVRAIGRALAKAFDIPVQEYDFTLPNARSRKLHFASDQLVVVGSPVYGGVMPLLVREYLAQYVTGEKTACVLAAIYGNRNFDDCLVEMQDLMEENGFVVIAAAACIGEHSYSTAIASGRPNAQDLALAEEFGRQVAQKLSASPAVPTLAQTLPGSRPYRERKPSAPMGSADHQRLHPLRNVRQQLPGRRHRPQRPNQGGCFALSALSVLCAAVPAWLQSFYRPGLSKNGRLVSGKLPETGQIPCLFPVMQIKTHRVFFGSVGFYYKALAISANCCIDSCSARRLEATPARSSRSSACCLGMASPALRVLGRVFLR